MVPRRHVLQELQVKCDTFPVARTRLRAKAGVYRELFQSQLSSVRELVFRGALRPTLHPPDMRPGSIPDNAVCSQVENVERPWNCLRFLKARRSPSCSASSESCGWRNICLAVLLRRGIQDAKRSFSSASLILTGNGSHCCISGIHRNVLPLSNYPSVSRYPMRVNYQQKYCKLDSNAALQQVPTARDSFNYSIHLVLVAECP